MTFTASANSFTFTGHEKDEETDLIYAKARFYDPDVGRFLTEDPAEVDPTTPPSLHKYMYAYANPNRYVDPDGRTVRVSGEERERLLGYYGEDNISFEEHKTWLGLGQSSYEVIIDEDAVLHMQNLVSEGVVDAEYARDLTLAILDPFWLYKNIDDVPNRRLSSIGDFRRRGEWIGGKYEGMVVPRREDGSPVEIARYNPYVIASPDNAGGWAWAERKFLVPVDEYKSTGSFIRKQILWEGFQWTGRHGLDLALFTIAVMDAAPGDEFAVGSRALRGSRTRTFRGGMRTGPRVRTPSPYPRTRLGSIPGFEFPRPRGSVGFSTTGKLPGSATVRVGRWMSTEEAAEMTRTGRVQESAGGITHVTNPANPEAFKNVQPGSVFVEFDVPAGSLARGGRSDWGIISGPNSPRGRLATRRGEKLEMPEATNIHVHE